MSTAQELHYVCYNLATRNTAGYFEGACREELDCALTDLVALKATPEPEASGHMVPAVWSDDTIARVRDILKDDPPSWEECTKVLRGAIIRFNYDCIGYEGPFTTSLYQHVVATHNFLRVTRSLATGVSNIHRIPHVEDVTLTDRPTLRLIRGLMYFQELAGSLRITEAQNMIQKALQRAIETHREVRGEEKAHSAKMLEGERAGRIALQERLAKAVAELRESRSAVQTRCTSAMLTADEEKRRRNTVAVGLTVLALGALQLHATKVVLLGITIEALQMSSLALVLMLFCLLQGLTYAAVALPAMATWIRFKDLEFERFCDAASLAQELRQEIEGSPKGSLQAEMKSLMRRLGARLRSLVWIEVVVPLGACAAGFFFALSWHGEASKVAQENRPANAQSAPRTAPKQPTSLGPSSSPDQPYQPPLTPSLRQRR